MATAHLCFFGQTTAFYAGTPIEISVKKAMALLAYLATTGKPHSRERLAVLLWPDASDEVARTSLRQTMRALRETPLGSILSADRTTIGLDGDFTSDVGSFQGYLDVINALSLRPHTLSLDTVTQMQEAAALYKGDFMEDFSIPGCPEWDDWQQFRRIEFQYQATQLFAGLAHYYTERQLADSGLRMAARWLELDPYNEDAHRLKMRLYALSRQTERAIEQYHLLVRMLARDECREPDPLTQTLYEQIRSGQFVYAQIDGLTSNAVRSILPKPAIMPVEYQEPRQRLLNALDTTRMENGAQLIVVSDSESHPASSLIAQIAHERQIAVMYPDGILWASLNNDLDTVLRLWMDALRISVLKSTSKVEHLAWQFHNALRGKRILLLLEHVDTVETARLLSPAYPGCALLVTTRKSAVADAAVSKPGNRLNLANPNYTAL